MAVRPKSFPFFVEGASAEVVMTLAGKEEVIGRVGLFTQELQRKYDLRHKAGHEPNWMRWCAFSRCVWPTGAAFSGIERDLSIVVTNRLDGLAKRVVAVAKSLPASV